VIEINCPRPVLRWHGGKWKLAPWIISHFPAHRTYTECYGGAASTLLRKTRSYAEIYNDLDGAVVNLFRVLRSDRASELVDMLRLTPFARDEFMEAYGESPDAVEQARRLITRSFMGFGSNGHARSTGFRANSNRSGTTPARDWLNYPDALGAVIERLRGVIVENRPAMEVMAQHDGVETLHYVDPPYVLETRSDLTKDYHTELSDADHVELLAFLRTLKGSVVLSGYPHPIYDEAIGDWKRLDRIALADGARKRIECLWLNPAAATHNPSMFDALEAA